MGNFGWKSGKLKCKDLTVLNSVKCKDLEVANDLSINGSLNFGDAETDKLTVNGELLVEGTATFKKEVTFKNETTFENDILITGNNVYVGGLVLNDVNISASGSTLIVQGGLAVTGGLESYSIKLSNDAYTTTAYAGAGTNTPATVAGFVKVTVGTTEYAIPLYLLTT